ncbi:MAG TPA: hypothetical protein VFA36_03250 [Burkholderiales bacterium]|nr:hypothetical protein [Burkholderiales bacterium]
MQLQGIAEESLGAEGVEAKGLPAFVDHPFCMLVDLTVVVRKCFLGSIGLGNSLLDDTQFEPDENGRSNQNADGQSPNCFGSHEDPFHRLSIIGREGCPFGPRASEQDYPLPGRGLSVR